MDTLDHRGCIEDDTEHEMCFYQIRRILEIEK